MLSVVEHFSKMRLQFSQFMSAFAALRFIRWAYSKLREMAGLQPVVSYMSGVDDGGVGSDIRDGRVVALSHSRLKVMITCYLKFHRLRERAFLNNWVLGLVGKLKNKKRGKGFEKTFLLDNASRHKIT